MSTSPSAPPPTSKKDAAARKVVRVVFFALVLDLLAFTMPLPLFPKIIDDFVRQEAVQRSPSPTFLSQTLSTVRHLRSYLFSFASPSSKSPTSLLSHSNSRFDLTLLGGLLGSTFSFCQFLISPHLGKLSDRYGRKPILLLSMSGNLVSAALWLFSGSFGVYALSRIVGGLSEGNVQLSIACITDVTNRTTRSRSLALVGIAFSLAFTLGPSAGAYFASKDLFHLNSNRSFEIPGAGGKEISLNSFAVPASITLFLLSLETIYLAVCLPETKGWKKAEEEEVEGAVEEKKDGQGEVKRTVEERRERLKRLEWIHFGFLFFFSGAEFTITFLTNNLFDFSNAQNGRLLGFIGILSSLLQGGYVRKASSTPDRTFSLALSGIRTCSISLFLLALLPQLSTYSFSKTITTDRRNTSMIVLYLACAGLAYVSATVVNSLNALASLETDSVDATTSSSSSPSSSATKPSAVSTTTKSTNQTIEKGAALGRFRSKGQLGRAIGPIFATGLYWCLSPSVAYGVCAVGAIWVAGRMKKLRGSSNVRKVGLKNE